MQSLLRGFLRWLPAALVMTVIFMLSSVPASELPQLRNLDFVARKAAHMLGYGLLAVAYWYALDFKSDRRNWAWLLALLYAISDELHQFITPGRHPWWVDVVVFDAAGALLGLWLADWIVRRRTPDQAADT
jgi:VanZ family protein